MHQALDTDVAMAMPIEMEMQLQVNWPRETSPYARCTLFYPSVLHSTNVCQLALSRVMIATDTHEFMKKKKKNKSTLKSHLRVSIDSSKFFLRYPMVHEIFSSMINYVFSRIHANYPLEIVANSFSSLSLFLSLSFSIQFVKFTLVSAAVFVEFLLQQLHHIDPHRRAE